MWFFYLKTQILFIKYGIEENRRVFLKNDYDFSLI